MAVMAQRAGYRAAILDADITGPSIPKEFGLHTRAESGEEGLYPVPSKTGIRVMSLNLLTEHETDPVVWRGPLIAGAVKQFWTDVIWGDVDCMKMIQFHFVSWLTLPSVTSFMLGCSASVAG